MRERPIRIGRDGSLVGVMTQPVAGGGEGRPAFLFLNAGLLHRVGPSRLHVRLARSLAREGFASLRFDFSGVGDSELPREGGAFLERSVAETREAMDHLERSVDPGSFVLFGLCSGAEVAHRAAVEDPRVVGMVPMDGYLYPTWRYYVHRYGPRLLRARSWLNLLTGKTYVGPFLRRRLLRRGRDGQEEANVSGGAAVFRRERPPKEGLERELRRLVRREVRMLQIFTGGLEELCTYRGQFRDAFRSVDFRGLLREEFFAGADHTFTSLEEQRSLEETVVGWAQEGWPVRSQASRPGRREGGERRRRPARRGGAAP